MNYLLEKKYNIWTIYHYVEHIQQFSKYIQKTCIKSLSEVKPILLERYLKYRSNKFRRTYKRAYKDETRYLQLVNSAIKGFMVFLYSHNLIDNKSWSNEPKNIYEDIQCTFRSIVTDYFDFCRQQRGIKEGTTYLYQMWIFRFINFIKNKKIKNIRGLKITDIDEFINRHITGLSRSSIISIHSVLRSFFRFLYMYDYIDRDLSKDIFSSKTYQQRLIPKHTSSKTIANILAQVDTKTDTGKRDYAILVLLVRYGLRPSEVIKLKISDIDFKQNKIYVRNRKSGKDMILPLMPDISKPILSYLRVRPEGSFQEVFISCIAPYRPLGSGSAISGIVARYINRTKINTPTKGAYLMRHSLAKMLLEKGVSITDIASILGHGCISSTMNYLRISIEELRKCTDNYANLL
jgi:site-specific recombinase XerD